ncbi:MAG: hypothetical protein AAF982_06300 [Pseudomonadota bacterium]
MIDDHIDAPENDDTHGGRHGARHWLALIGAAQAHFEKYQTACDGIDRRYAGAGDPADAPGDRAFQMFWANLEVLRPAIYARPPRPVVMPRHSGNTREVVRKASELLERVLSYDIEADDLHDTLLHVRDDLAVSARGVAWVLDNGGCIHVDRADFVHAPARKWAEVGWIARRAYLTRREGVERFGDIFWRAKLEKIKTKDDDDAPKEAERKAHVWEVWSKSDRSVIWVTEGVEEVLDERPPLIDVKGFFPCPRPAYGTLERRSLKPVPDYRYYQDQIDEINEMTARIAALAESLRLKGFYASGVSEIGEAVEAAMAATDNKAILVPVSNFAAFGGQALKDAIVWLPVEQAARVITQLVALRRQLIQDVYEITGLSDIMRGATEAGETATAQNLKAQYGSVRVRERQAEMVRVARDVIRMKAEIFAETVPAQELAIIADMDIPDALRAERMVIQAVEAGQPPDMAEIVTIEQLDAFLKAQRLRPFLLEVESDSTIAPNEEAEKQSRIEFIAAMGGFIRQAGAMVAQQPETAPFAAEMMKFAAGGFRAGRELGGVIDDFAEQVKLKASRATQQQGPTPEQQTAQAGMRMQMQKAQLELQKTQMDMRLKTHEARAGIERTQAETEKVRAETERISRDIARAASSQERLS